MEIKPDSQAGQLPIGFSAVLLTAPSGVITKVSTIIITNIGVNPALIHIFYRHGAAATQVRIFPVAYSIPVGGSAQESDTLYLWPLDTIEGFSTGASADYFISAMSLG